MSDDDRLMTLGELVANLQLLADTIGPDSLVDVDIEIGVDPADDSTVFGKLHAGLGEQVYEIRRKERLNPLFRNHGPEIVTERLLEYVRAAQHIMAGLDGQPFNWTEHRRRALQWKARRMGVTLISPTYAGQLGLRPIDGQRPVGTAEWDFGTGRRRKITTGSLYVMECQLEKIPSNERESDSVSTETEGGEQ